MPYKHISQKEARHHLARRRELERKMIALQSRWSSDYPGVTLGAFVWPNAAVKVAVARACGKAVIAINENDNVKFYAADF